MKWLFGDGVVELSGMDFMLRGLLFEDKFMFRGRWCVGSSCGGERWC